MNISVKLTTLCLFMVFSSSAMLFFFVNQETQRTLEEEIKHKLERESTYAINSIDRFIYERLNDIKSFSQDLLISSDTATPGQIRKRLEFFRHRNDLYSSLSYFDDNRIRIADTEGRSIGKQHSLTKYWLKAEQNDLVIDISHSESLGEVVIHFAAVVRNSEGRRIGLIVSRVIIKRLYEVFREAIESNSSHLFVSLIDSQGTLLYSNRPADRILEDRHPEFKVIHSMITQPSSGKQALHYFEHGDKLLFYHKEQGYLSFKGNDWMLVMSLPKASAFLPAHELRMKLLSIFLPLMVVAMAASLVMGRYFARPLVKLSKAAQEFGQGNLTANFDIESHQGDEIGILADRFKLMSQQLHKKITEQDLLNINLEAALKDIEKKNKNITASITYAERIQSSLLPDRDMVRSIFPDSFILFKPRDIVSGDFYWFRKMTSPQGDELAVVAAADCTGHGVPGALMSVIGNNLLYHIIVNERTLKPSEVLTKLNTAIKRVLKQDEQHSSKHDGMDIALCVINFSQMKLEFAGAHRPMLHFRNGELHEIKGDKISIGGVGRKEHHTVTNHEVEIRHGDTIYLFSDGYGDQFNDGIPSEKFSGKRMKKLLQEIQSYDMAVQQQLLEDTFEQWKGKEMQMDDVMVLGMKVENTFAQAVYEIAKFREQV